PDQGTSAMVRIGVREDAPAGTYTIRFLCCNDDAETRMENTDLQIAHDPDDQAKMLEASLIPPVTGRGVPISAITTNAPVSNPVRVPVNLKQGSWTYVHPIISEVTRNGNATRPEYVIGVPGMATDRARQTEITLLVGPGAPSGTYRVGFTCENDSGESEMVTHFQEMIHRRAAAQLGDPPFTGRGVPISAVTTSTPRPSPVDIGVLMKGGEDATITPVIEEVRYNGSVVKNAVVGTAGKYAKGDRSAYVRLAVKQGQPDGVYTVRFHCVNEDGETQMDAAEQQIEVGGDDGRQLQEARRDNGELVPFTGRGVPISAWDTSGNPPPTPYGTGRITVPVFMQPVVGAENQLTHTEIDFVLHEPTSGSGASLVPWTSILLRRPTSVVHAVGAPQIDVTFETKTPGTHQVSPGTYTIFFHCMNQDGEPEKGFKGGRLRIQIP
ncbi:MAG: hypothetical protein KDA21_06770, partial [Phycisphaerales bacterium]|nr:hypothetical protein [Phycisphaerales bacterium]